MRSSREDPALTISSTTIRPRYRSGCRPALAAAIGAKPPYHLPAWMGRLAIGAQSIAMVTESRGASNAKAKRELGWRPKFPSWRDGFRRGLGDNCPMGEPLRADPSRAFGEAGRLAR